jgi:FtsP/CotA-like multicopper oxidase with cupredoxin domain
VKSGDAFSVRLANNLAEPTNIHWHGLVIPPDMDGHPKDAVAPGGTFDYSFTVAQRAGTYWYHPHPHMATGKQVYMGMAGFFIVTDQEEEALGLPSGEFDLPLLVQDRRLAGGTEFLYQLADADHMNGFLGDTILVNGTPDPYLQVAAGLYRFRILNGSNARILDLGFADNRPFYLIGSDGGLLDRPYELRYLYMAPAERYEILVDFSNDQIGSSVALKSLGFSGGSGLTQGAEMPIIRFDVARPGNGPATIPPALATLEKLDPAAAVRTRTFALKIDHTTTPNGHTINDKVFEMMRVDEEVTIGDIEIWTFQNISYLPHPMHLHGAQFQVLDRNGNTNLEPRDLGWKDTVYVLPYQTVRVVVRFGNWPGLLLVHCHNLEHEDHGMMLNYQMVEQNLGVDGGSGDRPREMDLR